MREICVKRREDIISLAHGVDHGVFVSAAYAEFLRAPYGIELPQTFALRLDNFPGTVRRIIVDD